VRAGRHYDLPALVNWGLTVGVRAGGPCGPPFAALGSRHHPIEMEACRGPWDLRCFGTTVVPVPAYTVKGVPR
jgi:hypothetical protein